MTMTMALLRRHHDVILKVDQMLWTKLSCAVFLLSKPTVLLTSGELRGEQKLRAGTYYSHQGAADPQ